MDVVAVLFVVIESSSRTGLNPDCYLLFWSDLQKSHLWEMPPIYPPPPPHTLPAPPKGKSKFCEFCCIA